MSRKHTFLEVLLVGEVAKGHCADHHPQEEEGAQGFRLASTVTNQVPLKNRSVHILRYALCKSFIHCVLTISQLE